MKKIPLVVASINLTADFDGDGKDPGFEMEVKATYRDLPYEALLQLEGGVADLMNTMKEHGEVNAKKAGWIPAE